MTPVTPVTPIHRAGPRVATIHVPEQLVVGNRQAFKDLCLKHLEAREHLVVDFRDAHYLDSSGLGILVSLHKRFRESGLRLAVCSLNDDLATLWELTRMDSIIMPYRDAAAAERALLAA